MSMGLIADIVVGLLILFNVIICTCRGFIRCAISSVSSILAFVVAFFASAPLAVLCDQKFGWEAVIAGWNIPFISAGTLLRIFVGIALFIAVRLICIILDKILQAIKKRLKAVNILDRILGTVFGALSAIVEITFIFMFIESMGWRASLSLTADAGGYFAYRLYDFCRDHLFELLSFITSAASAMTPKL